MSEQEIFEQALAIGDAAERARFLAEACGEDRDLHERIERELNRGFYQPPTSALEKDAGRPRSMIDQPPLVEKEGTTIGPYRLLQKLGEGGMGIVYMAEQQQPVRRRVALKIIKPGMDSGQVVARFEAERQALAMMDHQNIAKVLDAGTTESGRPYFVMELVHGMPITEFCDAKKLSTRQRLELFVPVCQAVQHAHQKGVIHRDIKPSNVMVCLYDDRPVPKIIDFGVAKATDQRLTERTLFTQYGAIVGTMEYMAPEQAEISQLGVDTRSDIYSLGVLLYELLTGTTPLEQSRFQDAALLEILRIIKEEEPPPPSSRLSHSGEALSTISECRSTDPTRLRKAVRGELDWITMKCLEKDRARRYETANALAMDLRRYLSDEPVLAGPPDQWYRLRKFVWKNRHSVAAAGLLMVALLAGTIGTTVGMIRAKREGYEKEKARSLADEQRRRAQAISQFLEKDLLALADSYEQADAEMVADPDLKVRTLLLRAAKAIEGRFSNDPAVEAALRTTIGNALRGLGMCKPAIRQLDKAVRINERLLEPDSPEAMHGVAFLARALMDAGQFDRALPLSRRLLTHWETTHGERHDETLTAMNDLGHLLLVSGQFEESLPLLERALELRKQVLGANHKETLLSMNNLGACYFSLGRFDDSLNVHQQAYDIRLAKFGEDNPNTLASLTNVATAMLALDRTSEALPMVRKSVELHRVRMGPKHPDTLYCLDQLSWLQLQLTDFEEAIATGEQAVTLRKEVLGPKHPDTLQSMNNLAAAYFAVGEFEKSLALHTKAHEARKEVLGPEHGHTLISWDNVATSHMALGHADRAIPIFQHIVMVNDGRSPGVDNIDTLHARRSLAIALLEAGDSTTARTMLQDLPGRHERILGKDHPESLRATFALARAYESSGSIDKSIPLHKRVLRARRRVLGPLHPETLISTWSLAESQVASDHLEEAEQVLRKCLREAESGARRTWGVHYVRALLGRALCARDEFAEAEPLLKQGYHGMKSTPTSVSVPMQERRLGEVVATLIRLYQSTGKPADVARWRQEQQELIESIGTPASSIQRQPSNPSSGEG